MSQLREMPHQAECVRAIWQEFEKVDTTLVVAATGTGKTIIVLMFLKEAFERKPDARVLFLAHRQELISQPQERAAEFFPGLAERMGTVMAGANDADARVVVATIQTLSAGTRLDEVLSHGRFDYCVVDECFVAGTLVDGRPIESLRIGDMVTAWDEKAGRLAQRRVSHIFKRPAPDQLVVLSVAGKRIVCTPGHPFYTRRGWVKASALQKSDCVVQCTMQTRNTRRPRENGDTDLSCMWQGVYADQGAKGNLSKQRETAGLLFQGMQPQILCSNIIRKNGQDEPQVCQRADEAQESYARPCGESQDENVIAGYGLETSSARGQWQGDPGTTTTFGFSAGLADGSGDHNGVAGQNTRALPDVLQTGHCQRDAQGRDRGGRRVAWLAETASSGQEERGFFDWVGVDDIEILERRDSERFSRLCPNGFVYNLEVEELNTYTAEGIIVHNCHHTPAASYMALVERLRQDETKILGVTATPMRTDNDGLSKIFQSCAYRFPINAAIQQGVLVPFQALGFTLPVSFKGIGQTDDGWSSEPVGDLLKAKNILEIIYKKWQASGGGDRLTMGFTASVAQAYASAEYFREQGVPSEAADGTTPKDERAAILGRFQRGETRVLWNCQLFTEGYDCPEISCLIMAAPTKSDLIYVQRLGRGLRPAPGKDSCSVLDFAPLATRNVIMAGDVLGLPKEVREASDAAEEQGILLGGLSVDRFGRISTIDPTAVLVQHLNYISSQSKLAWSVGNRYTTATLNERVMVGIVLPNIARIEELEGLRLGDTWNESQEQRLTFARQSHVILMTKADRGWWESETWGDFDDLAAAHEAAAKLEQVYGDNALAGRTRRWRNESASPAQLNLMKKWKIRFSEGVSKGTASQLLSQWVANRTMDGWLKAAEQAATQLEFFA